MKGKSPVRPNCDPGRPTLHSLINAGRGSRIECPGRHGVPVLAVMGLIIVVPASPPYSARGIDHVRPFAASNMAVREEKVDPARVAVGRPLAMASAVVSGIQIRIEADQGCVWLGPDIPD